jgi:hypothetical protein
MTREAVVKLVNRTEQVTLGRAGGASVEAVVHVSGIDASSGARGFAFHRRDPREIVVRGEDAVTRHALRSEGPGLPAFVAPVALYALVRGILLRRRKS